MNEAAVLAAVLLGGSGTLALIGWVTPQPRFAVAVELALLVAAAGVAAFVETAAEPAVLLGLWGAGGVLATIGGGPVVVTIFDLVDGGGESRLESAGEILRGGAWIGALERLATFGLLVAGWPAGLAFVAAIKGLGRYAELQSDSATGAAERFIIGTLASIVFAAAVAGVVVLASG